MIIQLLKMDGASVELYCNARMRYSERMENQWQVKRIQQSALMFRDMFSVRNI